MNILGLETSCDETAVALVRRGCDVRGSIVASQITLHAEYGGVVPELAAREHLRAITPTTTAALRAAKVDMRQIDAVAVTSGPGLIPALLVGAAYGKGLAATLGVPFVGINHFLAHIYAAFLGDNAALLCRPSFPLLALVVSGGHTALVVITVAGKAKIVGRTLDDAAGEAFDKAARILDLGYPGGPIIDRMAKFGNPKAHRFPRSLTGATGRIVRAEDKLNFSFSGVKTALLYAVRDRTLSETELNDTVAGYQAAIVDVLVKKTLLAAETHRTPAVVMCGGVACNSSLRHHMAVAMTTAGRKLIIAPPRFCTDNAAMVAGLAHHYLHHGRGSDLSLCVNARLDSDLGIVPFAPDAESSS